MGAGCSYVPSGEQLEATSFRRADGSEMEAFSRNFVEACIEEWPLKDAFQPFLEHAFQKHKNKHLLKSHHLPRGQIRTTHRAALAARFRKQSTMSEIPKKTLVKAFGEE